MTNLFDLQILVDRFTTNIEFYKDTRNAYNEHSCRIEYIDPLLKLLGWDVENEKGLAPQYREVIAENYSTDNGACNVKLGPSKTIVGGKDLF